MTVDDTDSQPCAPARTDACLTGTFQRHRPVLTAVAYRMLGTVTDAEDIVQEAWLRWSTTAPDTVRDPLAYLVRVTTRLAVDRLRQARSRRETYVGSWLPEPLPTGAGAVEAPDGADRVLLDESVSLALLVVLESLSPLERAVFVLREAFGLPHAEIAETLGRSEAAVRQLAGRARAHVAARRPRYTADSAQRRALTRRFLDAAAGGDLAGLLAVLAPDVRLVGDSGGKAKAPLRVITTADKVGRFLAAVGPEAGRHEWRETELNGAPAVLGLTPAGRPFAALQIEVADGLVRCVHLINNPDKLAHLSSLTA